MLGEITESVSGEKIIYKRRGYAYLKKGDRVKFQVVGERRVQLQAGCPNRGSVSCVIGSHGWEGASVGHEDCGYRFRRRAVYQCHSERSGACFEAC